MGSADSVAAEGGRSERQGERRGYLSAGEAAAELGVSRSTLYSYVSRGLIRSEATGGSRRDRRYRAEDIERLKGRRARREDPAVAAREALSWGDPVLESGLTLISEGCLYYRGRDAVGLSRESTLEAVAALLWTGETGRAAELFPETPGSLQPWERPESVAGAGSFERFQALLPIAAAGDLAAYDRRPAGAVRAGTRIMGLLAEAATGVSAGPVAERLRHGWQPLGHGGEDSKRDLLNAALILCADHELNVSAFTVRCVASAGSTPYAAVGAGLCALSGVRHGGVLGLVRNFLQEVAAADDARKVIDDRLGRGDSLPGFGHRLYPQGDPRGVELLRRVREAHPGSPAVELARRTSAAVLELTGERPTVDLGLVVLERALGLPERSALTLFALGRAVGWIGHVIEQYADDHLIRPRARYTGERPETPGE